MSRLKYLIAAQGFTGASVAFFFDLLRGGTADRKEVVLLGPVPNEPLDFLVATWGGSRKTRLQTRD